MDLVERLETELRVVEEDLAKPRAQWKADNEQIMAKYFAEETMTKLSEGNKRRKKDKEHFSKLSFLLLQPEGHNGQLRAGTPEENQHQLKAYPNPASDQQTLEFVVAQKGMVTIELMDMNGKVVASLYNGKMAAGPQSVVVDLPEVSGNYYYLITDQTGYSTLSLMMTK